MYKHWKWIPESDTEWACWRHTDVDGDLAEIEVREGNINWIHSTEQYAAGARTGTGIGVFFTGEVLAEALEIVRRFEATGKLTPDVEHWRWQPYSRRWSWADRDGDLIHIDLCRGTACLQFARRNPSRAVSAYLPPAVLREALAIIERHEVSGDLGP